MTDKQIKSAKVFFVTVSAAYSIIDIFGGMKDNKNWHDTKEVVHTILKILEDSEPCKESLKMYMEKYETLLRIGAKVKAPRFAQGGIVPQENNEI